MAFEIKKNPFKIAICGTGSSWNLLPLQSNHTIYCLNDYIRAEKYGVKPDILFVMDVLDEKPQIVSGFDNLGDIIKRINDMGCPLIAPYKYEEIPKSEAFPLEDCAQKFGKGAMYFTNTICYMIAYAILQGVEKIELFGVNQAGSHEYAEEKGGVEWWLGIAVGKGIEVTIHGEHSQVLKHKGRYGNGIMYGYLQSYDQVVDFKQKFGVPTVHKLLTNPREYSRTARKVNCI